MPSIDEEVLRHARVIWDYHYLDSDLQTADFILALGSHDERVARHAADLVLQGLAPLFVPSGGFGKVTREIWKIPEGEIFAKIAIDRGVSPSKILIEDRATNTGENITRTRDLLALNRIKVSSGILVTKPYMRRRAFATATKQWPEIEWIVSSPNLSFNEYPDGGLSAEQMIELMVGDLQRIKLYADSGFQIPQEIPDEVWASYEELVRRRFDKYIIS